METDEKSTKEKVISTVAAPDFALTVIHPFGDYRRGNLISDPDEIEAVLKSENKHHCHKVAPQ